MSITITLQYFDGCPNWQDAERDVKAAVDRLGIDARIDYLKVETQEDAETLSFRGSPTILVAGEDPFAEPDAPVGLSCRVYRTADGAAGSPGLAALEHVLRHASA